MEHNVLKFKNMQSLDHRTVFNKSPLKIPCKSCLGHCMRGCLILLEICTGSKWDELILFSTCCKLMLFFEEEYLKV